MQLIDKIKNDFINTIKLNTEEINFLTEIIFEKEPIDLLNNYSQLYVDIINSVHNEAFINHIQRQNEVSHNLEYVIINNIKNKIELYNKWSAEIDLNFDELNFNFLIVENFIYSNNYIELLYAFDCFDKNKIDFFYNYINENQRNNLIYITLNMAFENTKSPLPLIIGKVVQEFINKENIMNNEEDQKIEDGKKLLLKNKLNEKLVEYEKRILMTTLDNNLEIKKELKKRI